MSEPQQGRDHEGGAPDTKLQECESCMTDIQQLTCEINAMDQAIGSLLEILPGVVGPEQKDHLWVRQEDLDAVGERQGTMLFAINGPPQTDLTIPLDANGDGFRLHLRSSDGPVQVQLIVPEVQDRAPLSAAPNDAQDNLNEGDLSEAGPSHSIHVS